MFNFTHFKQIQSLFYYKFYHNGFKFYHSHGFKDVIDPMHKYVKERGNISLPLELQFIRAVKQLPNHIYVIDLSIKNFPEEKVSNTLQYGSLDFNNYKNQNFLKQATKYLIKTVQAIDKLLASDTNFFKDDFGMMLFPGKTNFFDIDWIPFVYTLYQINKCLNIGNN